jgi:OmpA-OmpF porin, OOP family
MKKIITFLGIWVMTGVILQAQIADRKLGIALMGGVNQYNGDHGNRVFAFGQRYYGYAGGMLSYYLSPSFNVGLHGTIGEYGFANDNASFRGTKSDLDLLGIYKFNNGYIMSASSKWEPFVGIGVGTSGYRGAQIPAVGWEGYRMNDIVLPLAAGVKYRITDWLAVQYLFLYKITDKDARDGYIQPNVINTRKDHFAQQSLGLVFSPGVKKDADKDGVADNLDKCPDTPKGVKVDATGCPLDSDKDGVPDHLDKCPKVAGNASAEGCPDRDGDGIHDGDDECPDLAGKAEFKGCPDKDGDGIPDHKDACPNEAGTAEFKGCPDTDKDGIPDNEDDCPKEAGSKELKGCPDSDGDGVPNHLDDCPNSPGGANGVKGCPDNDGDGVPNHLDKCPELKGVSANKGCPEITDEEKRLFQEALEGIQFESGKDVIKPASYPILDKVSAMIKRHSEFDLVIEGHTDSQGDPAKNRDLSQRRAEAVMKYITNKGVPASQMTAKGFGDTVPVADNATPAGRAKNRRVEFKVNF